MIPINFVLTRELMLYLMLIGAGLPRYGMDRSEFTPGEGSSNSPKSKLEVAAALFVAAVAIEFDCVARTLT